MAENSKIEWTETTWNPIAGCQVKSPGCTNCYAMRRVAPRLAKNPATPHYHGTVKKAANGQYVWTGKIGIADDKVFLKPLNWRKPRMIFVNSTSDLFHPNVPDEVRDRVFAIMALTPQHTYQVLTKHPERAVGYMNEQWQPAPARTIMVGGEPMHIPAEKHGENRRSQVERQCENILWDLGLTDPRKPELWNEQDELKAMKWQWPLPNVWIGTSVERQKEADERIPHLLQIPAAVLFLSCEPLLGPIYLTRISTMRFRGCEQIDVLAGEGKDFLGVYVGRMSKKIDWVIVGGESGHGARPMHPDWARSIRDQCAAAGTPFFFKQWGNFRPAEASDVYDTGKGRSGNPPAFIVATDGTVHCFHNQHSEDGCTMIDVGKDRAGRLLDGVLHDGFPGTRSGKPEALT